MIDWCLKMSTLEISIISWLEQTLFSQPEDTYKLKDLQIMTFL